MPQPELKGPGEVRAQLATRYKNQHRDWLAGGGVWPLAVSLAPPSESQAMSALAQTRAWAQEWTAWRGPGAVQIEDRAWGKLGKHSVPVSVLFANAAEVAEFVGEARRWARASAHYVDLTKRWPALHPEGARHFADLADYDDGDWRRLMAVLEWLRGNRDSGLFPRQLPIHGIDTKWLEARMGLVSSLLSAITGGFDGDLYAAWGLRKLPPTIRLVVLDPALRTLVGGLRDIAAPIAEIGAMPWKPRRVLIAENLQSGLALPVLPDTVAILRLGYGVDVLAELAWVTSAEDVIYWGDIDTHGFAMLAIARSRLPKLQSILMDTETVESHKELLVHNDDGHGLVSRGSLTAAEEACYGALRNGRWGAGARLEQERIAWTTAVEAVCRLDPG